MRTLRSTTLLATLAAGMLLAACHIPKADAPEARPASRRYETLEGTVTYFERMALPRDARLVVWVGEEDRLNDPKGRIAEREMPIEGQVPVPFDLSFAADAVDPAKRYFAAAEIRVEGRSWFASPAPVRVLEGGIVSPVAIVVKRTAEGVPR